MNKDTVNKHTPQITPDERTDLFEQAAALAKTRAALGQGVR